LAGGNIEGELAACQRFYEKSYNLADAPGAITSEGAVAIISASSTTEARGAISFKVKKRATPVIVAYSPNSATAERVRNNGVELVVSGYVLSGQHGFGGVNSSSLLSNAAVLLQYTADAEL